MHKVRTGYTGNEQLEIYNYKEQMFNRGTEGTGYGKVSNIKKKTKKQIYQRRDKKYRSMQRVQHPPNIYSRMRSKEIRGEEVIKKNNVISQN